TYATMEGMGRLRNVRWKRLLLLGSAGSFLALLLLVGIGYALTDVPEPNESATATATRILYADRSEMGRVGSQNRIPIPLSQVPQDVQLAVLSAEDRGHYTNPGINPRGIARALFANVRGGGVEQGGSSITQQYAKNAFLTQERTFTRKVKEVFIALKMTREVDKDEILEDYLNTIYFGRQASGIEVAAQTYFNRPAEKLSLAQGAVIAASIKSPASLDPEKYPEQARARWAYVLDGMVEQGWLTQTERDQQVYPTVAKIGQGNRNNDLSGPKGHVISAVLEELAARGFAEDRLSAGGLVVTTTIRKDAQQAAIEAVQDITGEKPGGDELQGALVSVKPGTGEVFAYYGGATGTGFDFANQGVGRQPGSSFKPYVLATALEQGLSLRTRLDGNSPKDFPGREEPVSNFGREDFGRVDLIEATQRSINTAYYELGLEVGPRKVAELAHRAGIPEEVKLESEDGVTNGGIALGGYEVHVLDQAVGFATFANRGVPVEPFLVKKVQDSSGDDLYNAEITTGDRAFSEDVADDATFAMQAVVERGTGRGARLAGGREAAGKTGTSQDNKDAWFVGYTPQLSTAVWLGYAQPKTIRIDGIEATGGGFSSKIFKAYMDVALDGQPEEDFPPPANVGKRGQFTDGDSSPRPRRSRTADASPSATSAPAPSPTEAPPPPSPILPPPSSPSPEPQPSEETPPTAGPSPSGG
ncbi:MAG: transglycosylase domain-containing protein, partial [Candidatus Limnocylindrales bacterium]